VERTGRESLRNNQIRPLSDWGSSGRRFKSCQRPTLSAPDRWKWAGTLRCPQLTDYTTRRFLGPFWGHAVRNFFTGIEALKGIGVADNKLLQAHSKADNDNPGSSDAA
jgi:hypothetical protein